MEHSPTTKEKASATWGSVDTSLIEVSLMALVVCMLIQFVQTEAATAAALRKDETWAVQYSPDGFPTKIVIHRDASIGSV